MSQNFKQEKNIFVSNIFNTNIQISPTEFNNEIDETLLYKLRNKVEGKCDRNGYIKEGSAYIVKRELGKFLQGHFNGYCSFKIHYSVDVCRPVEGMILKCTVKNINKMGILSELYNYDPSPLKIILAKQHHIGNTGFEELKVNQNILVKIVAVKFEYNDNQISCIGTLETNNFMEEDDNEEEEFEMEENIVLEDDEEDISSEEVMGQGKDDSQNKSKNTLLELLSNDTKEEDETLILDNINLDKVNSNSVIIPNLDITDLDTNLDAVDLNEISKQNTIKVEIKDNELETKLNSKIFKYEILENDKYSPLVEPTKAINVEQLKLYYVYIKFNNLLVEFYNLNDKKPSKLYLNKSNIYKDLFIKFRDSYLSGLEYVETDDNTYVV